MNPIVEIRFGGVTFAFTPFPQGWTVKVVDQSKILYVDINRDVDLLAWAQGFSTALAWTRPA